MLETLFLTSITSSSNSGSGPPGDVSVSRFKTRSSYAGCPCFANNSSHQFFTFSLLVKNRWPPKSIRFPLYITVFAIPPTCVPASKIVTSKSLDSFKSWYPAVIPAGPAPMMTTFFIRLITPFLYPSLLSGIRFIFHFIYDSFNQQFFNKNIVTQKANIRKQLKILPVLFLHIRKHFQGCFVLGVNILF